MKSTIDIDMNKVVDKLIAGDVFSTRQFISAEYVKLVDIARSRGILVSGNVQALQEHNRLIRYAPYEMPTGGQLNYCSERNEIRTVLS